MRPTVNRTTWVVCALLAGIVLRGAGVLGRPYWRHHAPHFAAPATTHARTGPLASTREPTVRSW